MDHAQHLSTSLSYEGMRFAQRALETYLAGQHRAFVLDAGAAIEYLAKAAIATKCPKKLYVASKRDPWSEQELALLAGRPLSSEGARRAAQRLEERHTIGPKEALEIASKLLGRKFDRDATLVREARNRAVHAGLVAPDPAALAVAFVNVADHLATMPEVLWGPWRDVRRRRHLQIIRSLDAEAEVRFAQARARAWGSLATLHRKSRIRPCIPERGVAETCPACRQQAVLTMVAIDVVPTQCRPKRPQRSTRCLECLYCGLALFGMQVGHITRRQPPPARVVDWEEYLR